MAKYSIQQLLNDHFEGFCRSHKLPAQAYRTARHLMDCRTAKLGGHGQYCPNGHFNGVWYNSCKDRFCPKCRGIQSQRWLDKTAGLLLNCTHHHIVFTQPHELNDLWRYNRVALSNMLFSAASASLKALAGDGKWLGAKPAYLLAQHTWGRNLSLHPHLHCLMAHGGLDAQGYWIKPVKACLFPAKVVMILFRGKLLAALKTQLNDDALELPRGKTRQYYLNLCNKLGRKTWVVHFCKPYKHGRGVVKYLAKYIRGGPFNESQLQQKIDGTLMFNYTDHRSKQRQQQQLNPHDFIERLFEHRPAARKPVVRYYGLYQSSCREKLNQGRAGLGQEMVIKNADMPWLDYLQALNAEPRCRVCNEPLQHGVSLARVA